MSKQSKESWALFLLGSATILAGMWLPASGASALPTWMKVILCIVYVAVLFIASFTPLDEKSDREYWARRTGRW